MDTDDQPAMLGDADGGRAEPLTPAELRSSRDHPDVLAVCRWLPQPVPFGAFTGRHDHVHCLRRQGFVNLWWSDVVVHAGDYVGPPRGGLAPDPAPDYDVAMPLGGFARVRNGVLLGWDDEPSAELVIRADGEQYLSHEYGPSNPYFLEQYRDMTREDRLNALASVRRRRVAAPPTREPDPQQDALADAIAAWVAVARMPDSCPHCSVTAEPFRRGAKGLNVPGVLLRHGGAVATLTGTADADTSADVVWSLSRAMADPSQAGLVRAAEAAARRSADSVSDWPDGPLTEDAVALVAAQALRWHGERVAPQLPFWTLGWIFVARPILDRLLPAVPEVTRDRMRRILLERADRIRVDRVMRTWAAANDASQVLERFRQIAESADELTPLGAVIDLRDATAGAEQHPAPTRDETYERSVEAVVADLTA